MDGHKYAVIKNTVQSPFKAPCYNTDLDVIRASDSHFFTLKFCKVIIGKRPYHGHFPIFSYNTYVKLLLYILTYRNNSSYIYMIILIFHSVHPNTDGIHTK